MTSNLRPTTRECVHLLMRDHFRSCDKDGGHITGAAISENPMTHPNLMALSVIEPKLSAIKV